MRRVALLALLIALPALSDVRIEKGSDQITVYMSGKPYTTFYYGPSATKPYLHPLLAADGTVMTRKYPMAKVEGEMIDHPHHRGLWFAHGDINGLDYWGSDITYTNKKNAIIRVKKIVETKAKGNKGHIRAILEYLNADGKPVLEEDRTMTFIEQDKLRVIDLDFQLTALDQVKFGDTKEGMFAIRVAPWMEDPGPKTPKTPARTLKMVSSEGLQGDAKIWGSRAKWVDYSGQVDGKTLGIAIFDHPANFRHPTYWHARGYGLFAANPFGEHDFLKDKNRDGSKTLAPGEKLRFRYRVVIHPGDSEQAKIGDLYKQYAGGAKASD